MKDTIQKEILESIRKNNYNGIILGATGIGKGKVMIDIIKELDPESILYTCDNTRLRDVTFNAELLKWGGEKFVNKIDKECYQTVYKWENKEYELLLADEADFFITPEYFKFFLNNKFKKILLFTGTMHEDKLKIITKYLPVIHEVKIDEAEERGAVNKMKVYFVNYNLTAIENTKYLSFNESFKKLLGGHNKKLNNHEKFRLKVLQRQRNFFLKSLDSGYHATRQLMKKLYNNHNNKILIFCGLTEEADRICKFSYHGKNDNPELLQKFNNSEIRVLSVVDKIDRGENLNGVNCIIFHSPTRSKTKIMQRTGRGRRLDKDQITHCFFMIPFYKNRLGLIKPTVVNDYVLNAGEDLDLTNAKTINLDI